MFEQEKTRDRKSNCKQFNCISLLRLNEAAWIDLQDVRDRAACFIPLAFYSAARLLKRKILGTSANEKVREICALDMEKRSIKQGQSS